jgi:hypothetical protein
LGVKTLKLLSKFPVPDLDFLEKCVILNKSINMNNYIKEYSKWIADKQRLIKEDRLKGLERIMKDYLYQFQKFFDETYNNDKISYYIIFDSTKGIVKLKIKFNDSFGGIFKCEYGIISRFISKPLFYNHSIVIYLKFIPKELSPFSAFHKLAEIKHLIEEAELNSIF